MKKVRPQSSRPAFRQAFMTIDPATKFGSRRDLVDQAHAGLGRRIAGIASSQEVEEEKLAELNELNSAQKSGQTLDIGKFISESRGRLHGDRFVPPKPSLMKGKSEYTYHMNQTQRVGQVSQKAIKAHRLSPRSSRLLASTHFMNRNSTANSTLF